MHSYLVEHTLYCTYIFLNLLNASGKLEQSFEVMEQFFTLHSELTDNFYLAIRDFEYAAKWVCILVGIIFQKSIDLYNGIPWNAIQTIESKPDSKDMSYHNLLRCLLEVQPPIVLSPKCMCA